MTINSTEKGLTQKTAEFFKVLFIDYKIRSKQQILEKIEEAKFPQIKKDLLRNLKMRLKNEKTKGKSQFKLHELLEYCLLKKKIPEDKDDVFCGDYEYHEENGQIEFIRTFSTRKRLLYVALKFNLYF